MALKLDDVRTQFLLLKRDISDVSNATFVQWCRFLNDFMYRKVSGTDTERFVSTQSYSVTADPQTSTLPSDFKSIKEHGFGFFEVDSNGDDTTNLLPITGFGSGIRGYYLTGTNVVFTGIDNTNYKLRYLAKNTQLTDLTEYFTIDGLSTGTEIIPEEYLEAVIKDLDVYYTQWDEDPGSESLADFRWTRVLSEVLGDIKKDVYAYSNEDYTMSF